jgi:ABC-2 type transport system ATP-binding protein
MTASNPDTIIELKSVTKRFGSTTVLSNISWNVPQGHIVGLLGLNGSGKTTLLRLLMGIVRPSDGTVAVAHRDLSTQSPAIRAVVGYVAEHSNIPRAFTPDRLERVGRRVFPLWDGGQYEASLQRFHIARNKPIYVMSQGQRTLTAVAFALAHHAEILLLDEPTNGLDPLIRREFLANLIEEAYDQHRTVILSSHHLEEISYVAQDVAVLHGGKVVATGALDDLLQQDHLVTLRTKSGVGDLNTLPGVGTIFRTDQQVTMYIHHFDTYAQEIADRLRQWHVTEWTHHPVSLEQLFQERVGDHVG